MPSSLSAALNEGARFARGGSFPLRRHCPVFTEHVQGANGVADAIGYADPGPVPLRPTSGSYEEDEQGNGHEVGVVRELRSAPLRAGRRPGGMIEAVVDLDSATAQ